MTTPYRSGRTKDQFIRIAVIEGNVAYVPPGLFAEMQETAINPLLTEMERTEAQRRWLLLTPSEWVIAKMRGLNVVVDYEMEDIRG